MTFLGFGFRVSGFSRTVRAIHAGLPHTFIAERFAYTYTKYGRGADFDSDPDSDPDSDSDCFACPVLDLECGGKRYSARRRFGADGPESGAATRAQRGSCHRTPSCVLHQTGAAQVSNRTNVYRSLPD